MKRLIYPAIFHKDEEGIYNVMFPDIEGCITFGYTLEEAFNMAADALYACIEAYEELPIPTDIKDIQVEGSDIVMLVKATPYDEYDEVQKKRVAKEIETGLKERGYTQIQVAQILGVDRSYISRIAKGDKTPAPDMAKRIALLLGFDWHIFYGDTAR